MHPRTVEQLCDLAQLLMMLPRTAERDALLAQFRAGELTLDELIAELRALRRAPS